MADTIRTKAALTALLADNTTGDISAQDIRDMLISIMGTGYGGLSFATITNTGQTLTTSFQKITGWDTDLPDDGNGPIVESNAASGDITLNAAGIYVCVWFCSFTLNTGKTIDLRLTVNGASLPGAVAQRDLSTGGDVGTSGMVSIVSALGGDTIEAEMKINTTTATIDGIAGSLVVFKIG